MAKKKYLGDSRLRELLSLLYLEFFKKVDKETGKGLSTNDYTTTEKNKLSGIESGAQVNPTIDSSLSSSSTNAVQNKIVKAALDVKAYNSDVIETDTSNSTPFLYRETPYEADGVFLDKLVGGSVAWNQLVSHGNFDETTDWSGNGASISVSNNIGNVTFSSATGKAIHNVNVIANHVYLTVATLKATASNSMPTLVSYISSSGIFKYISQNVTSFQTVYILEKQSSIFSVPQIQIRNAQNPLPSDSGVQAKNVMCFDLTQMFGTTIADYIYSLEQATAGSGIAWLKSHGFFTKDYYPYNAGELISVKTSGKKYVGFNQSDEIYESGLISVSMGADITGYGIRSKNYNKCIGGEYYYLFKETMSSAKPLYVFWYDENKSYISHGYKESAGVVTSPLNARFFRLRADEETTSVIICINISKTEGTSKNWDYVPYEERTYDISNIDLRGIPKLVNNELVYDGDIYDSNGNVTRKYGIVDLGMLSWSYYGSGTYPFFYASLIDAKMNTTNSIVSRLYAKIAPTYASSFANISTDLIYCISSSSLQVFFRNNAYTDATAFKTAMSGVYLIYELATPTTETTDPYTNPQICDKDGTEEFIDNRTVPIPVGHNSRYADLPATMDGDYLSYMARNFASEEYVNKELGTKVNADDVIGTQTVSGNPITLTDASETYAQALTVELEPIQDLHGYDHPWVGGAGKNKLPMTVDRIKAANSSRTWTGNSTTIYGVTYTILTDDSNNVIGISASGTPTDDAWFKLSPFTYTANVSYVLNGCPANGAITTWSIESDNLNIRDAGNGVTITRTADYTDNIYIVVKPASGAVNLIFYPMIRLSTETDPTFAPYSNICPITGYTEVGVEDVGKNLFNSEIEEGAISDGQPIYVEKRYRTKNFIPVQPSTHLVFGINGTAQTENWFEYDKDYNYIGRVGYVNNFTTSAQTRYVKCYGTNELINNTTLQLEEGTTPTSYEPYKYSSASIDIGQTVYGGYVDFLTGECEVNMGFATYDGSSDENWTLYGGGSSSTYAMTIAISGIEQSTLTDISVLKSNYLQTVLSGDTWGNYDAFLSKIGSSDYIVCGIRTITSVADWRTYLASNPLQVCYELATPITIQLTPQELKLLKQYNNLTTNGTTIHLTYQTDNVIGDAVKASEEYTDRQIEAKPDSFAQLSDTSFSNLSNGQIPKWNSTSQKWENANESGGGLPAWTVLTGLGYDDNVELPVTFSELLVVVANNNGSNDLLSSSIFIADVADFDVSAERFPVLQIPIYISGSTMWSILEGSVSNNKRIYTLKGYSNSIAIIYYR